MAIGIGNSNTGINPGFMHIKILADCSILMVVGENRIRGTVESVYQLNKDAMATEDETGNHSYGIESGAPFW